MGWIVEYHAYGIERKKYLRILENMRPHSTDLCQKKITQIIGTNSLLEKMKIKSTYSSEECVQRENTEHKILQTIHKYCRRVRSFRIERKARLIRRRLSRLKKNCLCLWYSVRRPNGYVHEKIARI